MIERHRQSPRSSFRPPVPPSSAPGAWLRQQKENYIRYVSYLLYTYKVWYKNLWNWHCNWNLIIFDLLTSPKVTSSTLGWQFYLHSVLLIIAVNLICHTNHAKMSPCAPKSHPWGMTKAPEQSLVRNVLYLLFVRSHPKFGIKIFEKVFVIEILLFFTPFGQCFSCWTPPIMCIIES